MSPTGQVLSLSDSELLSNTLPGTGLALCEVLGTAGLGLLGTAALGTGFGLDALYLSFRLKDYD